MPRHRSFLDIYPPAFIVVAGLLLICSGGLTYVLYPFPINILSLILLVSGTTLFLQPSHGFRITNDRHFIAIIVVSNLIVIFVDFWPLQLAFGHASATILWLLGVPSNLAVMPHPGGLVVLLYVHSVSDGTLVGGEIDNACAGLTVLLPLLLLLMVRKREPLPPPNRLAIGLLCINGLIIGDLARIVSELWLPAVGLAPFDLVHYPPALLLGIVGLTVAAMVGHRWIHQDLGNK